VSPVAPEPVADDPGEAVVKSELEEFGERERWPVESVSVFAFFAFVFERA
jgi:hypothetical protein